ncbi:MAG: ribose 5-phosphate isomerase B [Huintestinicola sp.]
MIAIGSDHGGYELKLEVAKHLRDMGYEVKEMGCADGSAIDYPVVAKEVCAEVTSGAAEYAILICGTGIGISMAANKIKGIRAALCTDCYMAKYTRLHNNANVLCMGGRVVGPGLACEIVDTFLANEFEGGRHQRRIDLISELEK